MIEQEWWKNKLAEDIYATLKAKEQSLPPFRAQSPQLWIRRHLVDWLAVIVGELRVCSTAQHLGIYLMDYFMDSVEVEQSQLHLVAIVCLLIAGNPHTRLYKKKKIIIIIKKRMLTILYLNIGTPYPLNRSRRQFRFFFCFFNFSGKTDITCELSVNL